MTCPHCGSGFDSNDKLAIAYCSDFCHGKVFVPRSELPRLPDDAPMLVLRDAWGKTITDETPVNEETCPHTWTLEVDGGMWVLGAEVFKLMPEAQVRQANLLRDLVRVWNKIVALNAAYPEGQG